MVLVVIESKYSTLEGQVQIALLQFIADLPQNSWKPSMLTFTMSTQLSTPYQTS